MDEGTQDTSNEYENSWHEAASGKASARENMHIPGASALKQAETSAAKASAGSSSAKAAEQVANSHRWTGTGTPAQGSSDNTKLKAKKALPLLAIVLILIIATGVISFIGQSFQLFSLAEMVKTKDNKTSAAVYMRSETDLVRRLESDDPADGLSDFLIQLFADYGFEYLEEQNGDGHVARALVYRGGSDDATLIASSSFKNQLLNTLSTTGSAISQYRDLATVPDGQDEVAAAWYGALSVVSAGAWYDETANLAYDRLGLNPSKFNSTSNNPTDEAIVEAAKAGSATEDVNNHTGTTTRYVWTKHVYDYCIEWSKTVNEKGEHECTKTYNQENPSDPAAVWDWDSASAIGGLYADYSKKGKDPFPTKEHTAGEWCIFNNYLYKDCPQDVSAQSPYADELAFSGDEIDTRITPDDDQSAVQDALGKRAILSAFSTNPNYGQTGSSTHVSNIKSETSLISALSSMVKNKTTNFANNVLNATDKAKAGYGGVEMNYYGNLLNTPAESCGIDDEHCETMAATESSSFNSWFSDDIVVPSTNPIVEKYNVANVMEGKNIANTLIDNELTGNYNNMDNTVANTYTAENLSNSPLGDNSDELYNYCQKSAQSQDGLCPYGHQTLEASNYSSRVTDDVATYAYALTSIDLGSDPAGEEAMVAFNEGASLLDDAMLKQSSGTYGDLESTLTFYRAQQDYLAKLANYERQTKSPLDASSSNTFLGSIVSSLLPYATATRNNAIFSAISATAQVIGSSVVSLLPSAAATSLDELLYITEETTQDCTAYRSSDMLCDIYGNPIVIMDQSTADKSMTSIEADMESWGYVVQGSCASEEGCKLNENYDESHDDYSYTKWLFCTQNDTVVNNNLTTEKSSRTENDGNIFQAIIDFFVGLFSKKGEDGLRVQVSCGGNYAKEPEEVVEKYKVFAQFTLDQRIKVLEKYQEENTVTSYLRQYYAEHPLDQSYEGIIARQAGLSVDEVEQLFAYMEYTVYLARYDSSSRYQFVEPQSELELSLAQTDYDTMKIAAVIGKIQDFEELRSRNFAA